jgi:hypothetical protein
MTDVTGLPKAELFPAFCWICDHCGEDNFGRSVRIEPSHPDYETLMAEAKETMGDDEWCDGEWCLNPETVTCGHCGTEFATEEGRADHD